MSKNIGLLLDRGIKLFQLAHFRCQRLRLQGYTTDCHSHKVFFITIFRKGYSNAVSTSVYLGEVIVV